VLLSRHESSHGKQATATAADDAGTADPTTRCSQLHQVRRSVVPHQDTATAASTTTTTWLMMDTPCQLRINHHQLLRQGHKCDCGATKEQQPSTENVFVTENSAPESSHEAMIVSTVTPLSSVASMTLVRERFRQRQIGRRCLQRNTTYLLELSTGDSLLAAVT
jgi:hypothetical protein